MNESKPELLPGTWRRKRRYLFWKIKSKPASKLKMSFAYPSTFILFYRERERKKEGGIGKC
jgi:hypothetical protein